MIPGNANLPIDVRRAIQEHGVPGQHRPLFQDHFTET